MLMVMMMMMMMGMITTMKMAPTLPSPLPLPGLRVRTARGWRTRGRSPNTFTVSRITSAWTVESVLQLATVPCALSGYYTVQHSQYSQYSLDTCNPWYHRSPCTATLGP